MADSDRQGTNRFTVRLSKEQSINKFDLNKTLVNIMKKQYPDDPFYKEGRLGPGTLTQQKLRQAGKPGNANSPLQGERNAAGVVNLTAGGDTEYVTYDMTKTYPTADEATLDDLIDDEWSHFIPRGNEALVPGETGIFVLNYEADAKDLHDLYITSGPHHLVQMDGDVQNVFCVYYIINGVAYPIPNYKTLEVMLVEHTLTYDAIKEATNDQRKQFDLNMDGVYTTETGTRYDEDFTSFDEFTLRTLPDRSSEWNYNIRYLSGYRPTEPFKRDPGDYIQDFIAPISTWMSMPLEQKYFPRAFQAQTNDEMLREKYEGKMIIIDWPEPYDGTYVGGGTPDTNIDDKVNNLRMLVLGHWKQVTDTRVMQNFAHINNLDISQYFENAPDGRESVGRYGASGMINILINQGGIEKIPSVSDQISKGDAPLWNAFSHILEVDRLDLIEYKDYLDNYSNGQKIFEVEYMQPFEPAGSIAYYDTTRYHQYIEQALSQAEFTNIKNSVIEIWPDICSRITQLHQAFQSAPTDYEKYAVDRLGGEGPLYKIWNSTSGKWKYMKKDKTKKAEKNLFKIVHKSERIKFSLNENEENKIVSKNNHKWMRSVSKDKMKFYTNGIAAAGGAAVGATVILISGFTMVLAPVALVGAALAGTLSLLIDLIAGQVPEDKYVLPPWRLMKDDAYLSACIHNECSDQLNQFVAESQQANTDIAEAKSKIAQFNLRKADINTIVEWGDDLQQLVETFAEILEIRDELDLMQSELGVITSAQNFISSVDTFYKDQLKRQYTAIQYLRKKIHNGYGNKKFGIKWPAGPQDVLNEHVPGLTFDNYLHSDS